MRVVEGGVGYRNPAEAVVEFFSHARSKYHTISPFLLLLFFNSRWTNYNLICTRSTQSRFFCICFCRMNYTVRVGSYISIQLQTLNPLRLAILIRLTSYHTEKCFIFNSTHTPPCRSYGCHLLPQVWTTVTGTLFTLNSCFTSKTETTLKLTAKSKSSSDIRVAPLRDQNYSNPRAH